jgi:hypothetical protein
MSNRTVLLLLDDAESLREVEAQDQVSLHRVSKTLASGRDLRTCLAADPLLGGTQTDTAAAPSWLADFLPPLYVGAFGEEELEAVLAPVIDPRQVRTVLAATGGHPYLVHLLASQCCSGLSVEQACAQIREDGLVRDEVLRSLRSLSAEELDYLGSLARQGPAEESEPAFPRLAQLGLVHKGAGGTAIQGRLPRDWLAGNVPTSIRPAAAVQAGFGPFELLEPLGEGGMSQVYRALDGRSGQAVALKLLHAGPDPEQRARFIREARTCLRLSHPSIVQLYEAGELEGQCYLAMELCRGRPLRDRLAEGPMPLEEVLGFYRAIADALV